MHLDDGVMLGKGGVPIAAPVHDINARVPLDRQGNAISPAAYTMGRSASLSGDTVLHGPGAEPVPTPPTTVAYRCDQTTIQRNIEAWDLVQIMGMGDIRSGIEINVEKYNTLIGDIRRHFKAWVPIPEQQIYLEEGDPDIDWDTLKASQGVKRGE